MSRGWDHDWRNQDRVRGSYHRGHVVDIYERDGRLRMSVETVKGAVYSDVEIVHPIGFSSHPSPGENTEVLLQESGGEHSRLMAVGMVGDADKQARPKRGEGILYSPDKPEYRITVKSDGTIAVEGKKVEITADTMKIKVPTIQVEGDIQQQGSITSTGPHKASGHI